MYLWTCITLEPWSCGHQRQEDHWDSLAWFSKRPFLRTMCWVTNRVPDIFFWPSSYSWVGILQRYVHIYHTYDTYTLITYTYHTHTHVHHIHTKTHMHATHAIYICTTKYIIHVDHIHHTCIYISHTHTYNSHTHIPFKTLFLFFYCFGMCMYACLCTYMCRGVCVCMHMCMYVDARGHPHVVPRVQCLSYVFEAESLSGLELVK